MALFEINWEQMDQAPKDGSVIYGFFFNGKPSDYRADIRPIKWSGWGGGVWNCATTGFHLNEAPMLFTRHLPYPNLDQLNAAFQKQHESMMANTPEAFRFPFHPVSYN